MHPTEKSAVHQLETLVAVAVAVVVAVLVHKLGVDSRVVDSVRALFEVSLVVAYDPFVIVVGRGIAR